MPVNDGGEDTSHCIVIEAIDADNVEVSGEAISDGVATTSRRTHPTDYQLETKRACMNYKNIQYRSSIILICNFNFTYS